jgi:hypothetical protein
MNRFGLTTSLAVGLICFLAAFLLAAGSVTVLANALFGPPQFDRDISPNELMRARIALFSSTLVIFGIASRINVWLRATKAKFVLSFANPLTAALAIKLTIVLYPTIARGFYPRTVRELLFLTGTSFAAAVIAACFVPLPATPGPARGNC